MISADATPRFLVNLQPKQSGAHELPKPEYHFGQIKFQVKWIFSDQTAQGQPGAEWYSFSAENRRRRQTHWDSCHELRDDMLKAGYLGVFVEPDSPIWYLYRDFSPILLDPCAFRDSINHWQAIPERIDDHLDLTELRKARKFVADNTKGSIRIGHIDTGYDPKHKVRPPNLNCRLQRNFVDGEEAHCAADNPAYQHFGFPFQYGHGTGTGAILAGNKLEGINPLKANTCDYLGGAPFADVVPIRISESVIQLLPGAMASGINYATQPNDDPRERCDVVSISMGGQQSECWTRRVNEAYKSGVCIVAAAGNNYDGFFTTDTIWPARYNRVIAACGVMVNGNPYANLPFFVMGGNYGPPRKLCSSIAAYTPNVPWPAFHCDNLVHLDGAGTSAATPQIAAAAALYLQYWEEQGAFSAKPPWYRVEAARHALFTTAAAPDNPSYSQYLGRGILRAMCALKCKPPKQLEMTPPDTTAPPFVIDATKKIAIDPDQKLMYQVEIAQLLSQCRELRAMLADPDVEARKIPSAKRTVVLKAVARNRLTSEALTRFLTKQVLKKSIP